MSTRAGIGIKNADGSITATYLHQDGYVGYAGVVLNDCYKTPEKVNALVGLGNLSFLGKNLAPESGTNATRPEDATIAYHRDRNEKLQPAIQFQNEADYRRLGRNRFDAEYLYLFDGKTWMVHETKLADGFIDVETVIREKLAE